MKCCHILHIDLLMSHLIVYNFIIEPLINELNYLFIFNFGVFRRMFNWNMTSFTSLKT